MEAVLILSCGALGSTGTIEELRRHENFRIIGADSRAEHHGKYIVDAFYQIPKHTEDSYIEKVQEIIRKEDISYITAGHTKELEMLQEAGVNGVLASDSDVLKIVQSKAETYERFSDLSPEYEIVRTKEELIAAAERMGYPNRKLCFKPVIGSGARGFRILVDVYDKTSWTFDHKTDPHMRMDELLKLDFPPILLMEYLEGPVYHIDILAYKGEVKKIITSYRLEERFGFGFALECVDKPEYEEIARRIVKELNMSYNCFVQIKGGKLLEVGGRTQGSVAIGQDLVYGAIQLARGKYVQSPIKKVRMIRQWNNIFVDLN